MKTNPLTHQSAYVQLTEEAKQLRQRIYSDIIDDNGFQYVDLVQEGGGILGIALAGYTAILEAAGIRFFHMAGTSAGAINTLLLSASDTIDKRKSEKIAEHLASQDLSKFIDGNPSLNRIFRLTLEGVPWIKVLWKLLWHLRAFKRAFFQNLGLNPGKNFELWIENVLAEAPHRIKTTGEWREKLGRAHFPIGLKDRISGLPVSDDQIHIHLIAADITTQTKVLLPEMASLYWGPKADEIALAKLVRASISVPFLFIPFTINHIPNAGEPATDEWKNKANYYGTIPSRVRMVDGGLTSNFPIDLFHTRPEVTPRKPTFGVKLKTYRKEFTQIDHPGNYIGSMINTMRNDADNQFLHQHPDYQKLICFIEADKAFNWLDFNICQKEKQKLFLLGASKGLEFLKSFNWTEYKKSRAGSHSFSLKFKTV